MLVELGSGTSDIISSKDLIIRPQTPRFFTERDQIVLSAVVHNYLKSEKSVQVVIENEGGHLKLLDEAKSEDGTLCLRLQGVDFGSEENTIWIGKDDLLIRKIETVKDPENRETTIYKPQTGVEIIDGELVFRTPEAKN